VARACPTEIDPAHDCRGVSSSKAGEAEET